MMILVGGEKGGSGKSCLAQNIAVYLRCEKKASVLMVDCDPQRTTSDWAQERSSNDELRARTLMHAIHTQRQTRALAHAASNTAHPRVNCTLGMCVR